MDTEEKCKHDCIARNCYECYLTRNKPQYELDIVHEAISSLKVRICKLEEYRRLQIDENRAVEKHLTQLDEDNSELNERQNDLNEDIIALKDWMSELERMQAVHIERSLEMQKSLSNLENMSDFKQLEACILAGSQTHLSILKFENKMIEIEKQLKNQVDINVVLLDKFKSIIKEEIIKTHAHESAVKCKQYFDENEITQEQRDSVLHVEKLLADKINTPPLTGCYLFAETPKTTGLTFEEAIVAFKVGKKIRRTKWINTHYIIDLRNYDHEAHTMDTGKSLIDLEDILSTDWEIVE